MRERENLEVLWTYFSFNGAGPRHELSSARCGSEYLVALKLPIVCAHEKYQSVRYDLAMQTTVENNNKCFDAVISKIVFSQRELFTSSRNSQWFRMGASYSHETDSIPFCALSAASVINRIYCSHKFSFSANFR